MEFGCALLTRFITYTYDRERQSAEAAEEARRKAEVAAKKAALQAALQSQLQERAASKQQASAAQREELANINQSIQVPRIIALDC